MKLNSKNINDVFIIEIEGEIMGGSEADDFKDLLYNAIEDGYTNVVIDLEKATWMNSSGLGMLIMGLTSVRSSEGDLRLANVSERIKRPLEITKLDSVFSIYNSVEQAISSFK